MSETTETAPTPDEPAPREPTPREPTPREPREPSPRPRDAATENARPASWPPWAEGALEAMRVSPNLSAAARRIGIDRRTLQRFVAKDEDFAVAMHDAREQALDSLEDSILLRARTGMPVRKVVTHTDADGKTHTTVTEESHMSDVLAMFFLKRWRPEYREAFKVEQSGQVTVKLDNDRLDRDIQRILDDLAG